MTTKMRFPVPLHVVMAVIASVSLATGGCIVSRAELTHDVIDEAGPSYDVTTLVENLADVREGDPRNIGTLYNMIHTPVGHLRPQKGVDLVETLTEFVAETLEKAGYQVVTQGDPGASSAYAILAGDLTEYWGMFTLYGVHHCAVKLKLYDPGRTTLLWEGEVRGDSAESTWGMNYDQFVRASTTLMLKVALSKFAT